jgi:hypothetical protein
MSLQELNACHNWFPYKGEAMTLIVKRSEYRRAFDNLGSSTLTIDRRCIAILTLIQDAFARESTIGADVCRLIIDKSGNAPPGAKFESPLGTGRIIRKWSVEGAELLARLVFERSVRNQYDKQLWQPIWEVTIPVYGSAVSGEGDEAISFSFSGNNDQERGAAFAAALSILRGLVD